MLKPTLIKKMPDGATIHYYPISGGKTTFFKYLSCREGVCNFHNEYESAMSSLQKMT